MKDFKLVRKENGKYTIKVKSFFFWWETLQGTYEFDSSTDCVTHIHEYYDKDECNIIYNASW